MRRQTADGSATVEFALVLPLFVMLLLGLVEFGLAIWHQEILTNASREGARAGIVASVEGPTYADITAVVQAYLSSAGLDPAVTEIDISGLEGSFGDPLTVEVRYPHSFFVLPNLLSSLGSSLILHAKTVMLLE